ncbi:hypothetical protein [Bradyrhizobium sp. McL0616]|uniref:hypothetical protein n=1 Tax=Bradyrhizobium sp. McL0616 TaxID=3415674 RepID=UPI003CF50C6A
MSVLRAIALFMIVTFGGVILAAGFMAGPATAGKMNGKPGGGPNVAHYGTPKSGTPTAKPPAKMTKPAAQ